MVIVKHRSQYAADAYANIGARPTFTCAPYLLDDAPAQDEAIGSSESNAVIFADSVLGARFGSLGDCVRAAITGRADEGLPS